jgi:hypothetical protein
MTEAGADIPAAVRALIGVPQHAERSSFAIEMGYVHNTCAAVQNGNPLFWDEAVAREITHGWIAPPTMMSVWFRPHYWVPGATGEKLALQLHFDLKRLFELPEAIIAGNETVSACRCARRPLARPPGAAARQRVKTTRVGVGRFWVIDLECAATSMASSWAAIPTTASATGVRTMSTGELRGLTETGEGR